MKVRSCLFAITALVMALAAYTCGQTNPNLEAGLKPYGSFHGGEIDLISNTNGNLVIRVPLVSYPQRGGKISGTTLLQYNNKGWQERQTCNRITGICTQYWNSGGVKGVVLAGDQGITYSSRVASIPGGQVSVWSGTTADGSTHQFANSSNGGSMTVDVTGFWIDATSTPGSTSTVAIDRTGVRFPFASSVTAEDPNGNETTSTGGDTLGRSSTSSSTTDFSNCTGRLPIYSATIWNMLAPNGSTAPIKLCYARVALQTNFQTDANEASVTPTMLQSIVLPTNPVTAWTFDYNSRDAGDPSTVNYGDLTQVTFPTGGTIKYSWLTLPICGGGLTPVSRAVATRTLNANDGTGDHTWTYTWAGTAPNFSYSGTLTNTVTDPLGNDTVHTISGLGTTCSYYETQTQTYQGSHSTGTLLRTDKTDYSWTANPEDQFSDGTTTAANVVAIRNTTIWPNGKAKKVERDYDSTWTATAYTQSVNSTYGDIVAEREYDYGPNSTPGALLRETDTYYKAFDGSANSSSYRANNLLDLPSSVTIKDGGGTKRAQTAFAYDEYSLDASSVTMQHDSSPPDGTYRGNLTTTSRWLNTTGGTLSTHAHYFDTGTTHTSADAAGNTTTYAYSPTFYGAYVTQTNFPDTNSPNLAHHVISGNYDFNTGLLTSFTGESENFYGSSTAPQTTNYQYDSMFRLTQASFANGATTTFTYSPTTVERTQSIDSTRKTDLIVYFDGVGREIARRATNDESSSGVDISTECYDAVGNVSFDSYPFQGSTTWGPKTPYNCQGTAGDTFAFDGLRRQLSVTHSDGSKAVTEYTGAATKVTDEGNGSTFVSRISQVDGLGRLTAVCEVARTAATVGTSTSPVDCGLDAAAAGFLTTYAYDTLGNLTSVTQGSLQQRTFVYDSLSRLTKATNPETTATGATTPGAFTYTYDVASGNCGAYSGELTARTDNRGITTCYSYDPRHRLIGKKYWNGSTQDSTPAVTINYDESTSRGVSLGNYTIGLKTTAYTSTAAGTSAAEIFGYDSVGHVLNNSQCTPANCSGGGVQSVTYQYDLLGDITKTSSPMGNLTYTYNVAGRVTNLASSVAGTPTNGLLRSASYNGFGEWTSAVLGNGLTETRGYTPRGWFNELSVGGSIGASGTVPVAGVAGTGSVGISGSEQTKTGYHQCGPNPSQTCPYTIYDSGTVQITANGHSDSTGYGPNSTSETVASGLATAINGDSAASVVASASGSTVYLTARSAGASTDYTLSASSTYSTANFSSPSFTATPSGSTLTGGANGVSGTMATAGTGNYWFSLTYGYDGDVANVNDSVNGQWTFQYDDMNRLFGSTASGGAAASLAWVYDRYGNRWQQNYSSGSSAGAQLTFDAFNHISTSGYTYDANGNLTVAGTGAPTYAFDAENRLTSNSGTQIYWYDANGRKVKSTTNGDQEYLYDLAGDVLVELNGSSAWTRGEAYAAGHHIATYKSGTVYFDHDDWLGTERYRTTASAALCESVTSWPYGDNQAISYGTACSSDVSPMHFTGKERDSATSLDYFGARYYGSTTGRFMTPDSAAKVEPVPYAKLDKPQSLNLYSYVLNNPLTYVDADGHVIDDKKLERNQEYQKWKKEYLSHEKARGQWDALNNNKTLTVHVKWDAKAMKSVTNDYKWTNGHLDEATVTLGKKSGDTSYPMTGAGYQHGSDITDNPLRQAYVIAHELAHVEYAQTTGAESVLNEFHKNGEYLQNKFKELGVQPALRDPGIQKLNQQQIDTGYRLEHQADERAWEVVRPQ